MLRQFIACKTRLERLRFFQSTTAADWESHELDTIMNIMGLGQYNVNLTNEDKYMNIYSHLAVKAA